VFPTWTEWMSEAAKILALYVSARLSLVFPATAIDKRPDLKWSWNLTRNNGWRMVVVVGVLPWVIGMIVGVLYRENATVLETIVLSTLGIALFAVEIAALSLSYRELTKEPEAPG
jgi:membrane-anchored glycerophosphoryl diester phosphodiesterase (GDPDase)